MDPNNTTPVQPQADIPTGVVGDVASVEKIAAPSLLDGLNENTVVALHNPLPSDFRVQYARSIVAMPQLSREALETRDKAGMPRFKEQNPMQHSTQFITLKAGETKNLPGDIAQIAGRKLVSYILMAQAGKNNAKMVADGFSRREIEDQIVEWVQDRTTYMNLPPESSAQEMTDQQIDELNPTPKEAEPITINPPPGQGISYEPARPSPTTAE